MDREYTEAWYKENEARYDDQYPYSADRPNWQKRSPFGRWLTIAIDHQVLEGKPLTLGKVAAICGFGQSTLTAVVKGENRNAGTFCKLVEGLKKIGFSREQLEVLLGHAELTAGVETKLTLKLDELFGKPSEAVQGFVSKKQVEADIVSLAQQILEVLYQQAMEDVQEAEADLQRKVARLDFIKQLKEAHTLLS